MPTKTVLAQRLRAARQAIHPAVTQRQVAERLKCSPSAVNLWEAGKTQPSAEDLAELSRWYNVSSDWLLGVEIDKPVRSKDKPPFFSVPVVPASALLRWHWEAVTELLQTAVLYPAHTAAAMLVSSDALRSACPTGCYAVISKAVAASPGQVVLAAVSRAGEPVLRRFLVDGAEQLLVADDTRFPTYRVESGVQILGCVTEVTIRKILG